MNRFVCHFFIILLACFSMSQHLVADELIGPYRAVPARSGEQCTVCGADLTGRDSTLIVKGRRVPLDRMHLTEFMNNQDKYFAVQQPRGALFAEAADAQDGTVLGGVSSGWFAFGMYVLVALLFGGLSSYAAIGKGLPPIPYFITGFVFSVVGYLYVLSRPRKVSAEEIPAGLVKVPVTSSPVNCGKCGSPNHPSAKKCFACGTTLVPKRESEVARVH